MITLVKKFGMLSLLAAGLALIGCDDNTVDPGGESRQVNGRVTNNQGYGKRAADIEGAAVTASSVRADGSLRSLNVTGQATTNAEGEYSIDVEDATEVLIVQAQEGSDFTTRTLVYAGGQSEVDAMPMTIESKNEADVYVEARSEGEQSNAVTTADVAVYVDQSVAGDIESGATSTAEVAAAIRSASEAEFAYFDEDDEEGDEDSEEFVDDVIEQEQNAFAELQAELSGQATSSTEAQAAVEAFEEAAANAYLDAGASAETQAKARQSGSAAAVQTSVSADVSSDARLGLKKRAEILAAFATAEAIETSFEAEDASQAQIDALADARTTLIASLRSASNADAMAEAKADYRSAVEAELAETMGVNAAVITTANAEIDAAAETTLDTVLDLVSNVASQVASAYASFYADAEAAAETSLSSAGASNASLGAQVLVMLEGMASIG